MVSWALWLINVWENAHARLIYAHEVFSAWCSVSHKSIFSVITWRWCSTGCSAKSEFKHRINVVIVFCLPSDHLLAFVFDTLDWYDGASIRLIHSNNTGLTITILTLQRTANYIPGSDKMLTCSSKTYSCLGQTYSCSHFLYTLGSTMPQWPLIDPFVLNWSKHCRSAATPP